MCTGGCWGNAGDGGGLYSRRFMAVSTLLAGVWVLWVRKTAMVLTSTGYWSATGGTCKTHIHKHG